MKHTLNDIKSKHPQYEVDFIFPDADGDIKVYLDLYLMYESKDQTWNAIQAIIFDYFNNLLKEYRTNKISENELVSKLHFPEVELIGFGHCASGIKGQGGRTERASLIKNAIFDNKQVSDFGIESLTKIAIEIPGIGPDLLSDLVGNFAVEALLEYTKEQVETFSLKTIKVPIPRYYDLTKKQWGTITEFDLPYFLNNGEAEPRILVPRQIVRRMPILSVDQFQKGFLKYVLQDEEVSRIRIINTFGETPKVNIKDIEAKLEREYGSVSLATRKIASERPELVKKYAENPHKYKNRRRPRKRKIDWQVYINELKNIPAGEDPQKYTEFLRKTFSVLYGDNLLRGHIERRSVDNVFRYDINFLNASQTSFFKILNNQGIKSGLLIIEAKNYNKTKTTNKEFNQCLAYTIKDARELVFLIKRQDVNKEDIEKSKRHFLAHGVVILPLGDIDVIKLLSNKEILGDSFDDFLNERLQEILST